MLVIDQIFYCIATYLFKTDGPEGARASLAISIMVEATFLTLVYFIACLVVGETHKVDSWLSIRPTVLYSVPTLSLPTIGFLVYRHYRTKYAALKSGFANLRHVKIKAILFIFLVPSVVIGSFVFCANLNF